MSTIVTRAGKGSPLSNAECDDNFTNLNTDKLEINAALGTPASVTLTNATGLPTAGLVDNAVTDAKLRDSAGLSVIGRGANSTGDPADIVAGTNHQVLRRDGSSLGFGAVDLSSNQAVTGTLPVNQGGTGITSFGSGVATWLGTPTSANLAAAVTDETGTGTLVFGTNPVIDGATIPARTNPLAQAVSVQMTASTTVGGIQQLSAGDLNMGTNDFTIHWDGSIPNWLPGATTRMVSKRQSTSNYWQFRVNSSNRIEFVAVVSGVTIISGLQATQEAAISPGQYALITAVVIRETVSTAGSITYYVNGVPLGSPVVIPAAATASIDNTGSIEISAFGTVRGACRFKSQSIYNRALTAAEVLDLSINGVALADRGASQTPVYESDFSAGVDGWAPAGSLRTITGNIDGIDGEDDWAEVATTSTATTSGASRVVMTIGKRYSIKIKANRKSGSNALGVGIAQGTISSGSTQAISFVLLAETASGEITAEITATSATLTVFATGATGTALTGTTDANFYFKSVEITNIGLTSELIASNAQSDTGQILDSSGNKNHALLPASGATVVGRPVSQTREVRWTNTWAGTNELQYIGGVNQAILPANAYIESIIGTVSGATPHDIIIGDGSDTDRYVTITTGLAAGTTNFALAARTTDGTNLKLTVDPDTDCSMSIAWVISYRTLE